MHYIYNWSFRLFEPLIDYILIDYLLPNIANNPQHIEPPQVFGMLECL